jgi:hypothetical protein
MLPLGTPMCGAKVRSTGQPCKKAAMKNGRCRSHGGAAANGIAHANFKTGEGHNGISKYSPYVRPRLLEKLQTYSIDQDKTNLGDDIALIETRLADVLERMEARDPGQEWHNALRLCQQVQGADEEARPTLLADLEATLTRGRKDPDLWREIRELIDNKRKLAEAETKRVLAAETVITAREFITIMTKLGMSLREHLKDNREILVRVQRDIVNIIGAPDQRDRFPEIIEANGRRLGPRETRIAP